MRPYFFPPSSEYSKQYSTSEITSDGVAYIYWSHMQPLYEWIGTTSGVRLSAFFFFRCCMLARLECMQMRYVLVSVSSGRFFYGTKLNAGVKSFYWKLHYFPLCAWKLLRHTRKYSLTFWYGKTMVALALVFWRATFLILCNLACLPNVPTTAPDSLPSTLIYVLFAETAKSKALRVQSMNLTWKSFVCCRIRIMAIPFRSRVTSFNIYFVPRRGSKRL